MGRGGQRPPSLRQLQSPLVGDVAKAGLAPPEPAAERWILDPKYAIYAFTYLLSLATGAGAHLVPLRGGDVASTAWGARRWLSARRPNHTK